ncbi:hypothetical protein K458DRAFT_416870 [Lentithecium fluviatile CBS 122367]|uniref:Uncharacterized protein n=1 Tax=Lentithecium fluviatile CBS 122367 TaxID=1168545 RepID=A0A6G1J547_9PLEO|nr:hypothetical protein K458DRAFT_416870 [Lentithecium fluviatile CBS 122367]
MANRSAEVFDLKEGNDTPSLHRSRSGGYADYLEEKTRWDRRNRERQMKRYHDSHLSPTDAQASDRLYVPAFEPTHRRSRSHEHIEVKEEEPARSYKLREAVPARLSDPKVEPARSDSFLTRRTTERTKPRRPSIKVHIHQDNPPLPASSRPTPTRSPSASPRPPSAVPQLQYQCATLQHKLRQIGTMCSPYLEVEAAHPRDITFAKIAEQCKGFAFELDVWRYIAQVDDMAKIDSRQRKLVEAASRTLDRMTRRVEALSDDCSKVKPGDLKVDLLPEANSSESDEDEDDDDTTESEEVTESPAFIIQYHLNSIQTQIQTLKRLSRSLQEATPSAMDEVVAVGRLVDDLLEAEAHQSRNER